MAIGKAEANYAKRVTLELGGKGANTLFDGITHHLPEGMNFKSRAEQVGWKQAEQERDTGTCDWTCNLILWHAVSAAACMHDRLSRRTAA